MATEKDLSSGKSGITDRLKQDSKQKIETGKRSAADQIDQVAQALSRAGEELNQSQPTLANYAGQIASTVSNFATRLRDGNMDELVNDTRELARRNPGLFLLGGVAFGFALSRFLKASAEQQAGQYSGDFSEDYGSETYGSDDYTQGSAYTSQLGQDATLDVESPSYSGTGRSREDYTSPRSNGG
jgi:hypothetical protein